MDVRYVRHPTGSHLGPAAARNLGVAESRGRFLFWLDDDDEFLVNRFDECLPLLESGKAEVVFEVAARERLRTDGAVEECRTGPGRPGAAEDPFRFLLTEPEAGHIATGATSFTRESFDRSGGLDESLDYGEDGEFLIRLALRSRVALLAGAPVVRIHQHATNISRPSQQNYWGPLKSLRASYRNNSWSGKEGQRRFLADQISGKLDYLLTRCRLEYDHSRRYREGALILRYFPWTCLQARNLRSILVWLLWPGRTED